MEKNDAVQFEDTSSLPSYSDGFSTSYPFQGLFDVSPGDKSSLGFMELLGLHDNFNNNNSYSLFDMLQTDHPIINKQPTHVTIKSESSPLNIVQPATPNSSSISSESSEAVNDEQMKAEEEEEEEQEQEQEEEEQKTKNKP
ncbi:hypothetical protein ACFE04_018030 [Oxalis oulophora]